MRRRLRQARRSVAAALLDAGDARTDEPTISGWRAWLVATWIVVVLGAYLWGIVSTS